MTTTSHGPTPNNIKPITRSAWVPTGWAACAVVVAFAALLHGLLLGHGPLALTEGMRARVGSEMLASGEWVVPHIYGQVYLRKPPGHPWLIAASEAMFGANEWAYRLPSALAAVLTAALMWWAGRRWFGELAGLVSGLSCAAIVAIWSQSRSAEIDAANTLALVAAGVGLIEMRFGRDRRRWLWVVMLAAGWTASMLLKGPVGLPMLVGLAVGGAIGTRRWRGLLNWKLGLALAAGVVVFAGWLWLVQRGLADRVMPMQGDGAGELAERLTPSWGKAGYALAFPFIMLAYGFPVTLAAVWLWTPWGRRGMRFGERVVTRAVAGGVIGALVCCGLALMDRPRYAYIVLPLACPLVGAVASAWARGAYGYWPEKVVRDFTSATAVIFGGAAGVMAIQAMGYAEGHAGPWPIVAATAAGVLGVGACAAFAMKWRLTGAWLLVPLVLATSVTFDLYNAERRWEKSWAAAGLVIREHVGPGGTVIAENVARDHTEAFYYGRVDVTRDPRADLAAALSDTEGGWVVLDSEEAPRWTPALKSHGLIAERIDLPVRASERPATLVRLRGPMPTQDAATESPR